jgi:mRNA degradation ribonuclease J1/J2
VIPGNELAVQPLVDAFVDAGVDVVAGRRSPHVSGHGHVEDLRLLLMATRPHGFVALHGNPQNLVGHGTLAKDIGLDARRIHALRDGHTLVIARDVVDDVDGDGGRRRHANAPPRFAHVAGERAREPAVQGSDVAWFPRGIAKARDRMAQAGVLVVVVDDSGVVAVHERGVFPDVADCALVGRARAVLHEAVVARGGIDDHALRAATRVFRRADRACPEIVVVPAASKS